MSSFKEREEAGLFGGFEEERFGLNDNEKDELNSLLSKKKEPEPPIKPPEDFRKKIKNLLVAVADFL